MKTWAYLFSLLTTMVALVSVPLADAHSSPRRFAPVQEDVEELYIKGWFLETVERDLEGALKLYKQCAEKATLQNRELAAKALYRLSLIKKAQGKQAEAEAIKARLTTEFPQTEATLNLERTLTSVPNKSAQDSAQNVVEEAKALLREVCLSRENFKATQREVQFVFSNLSAEQVVSVAGENLPPFLQNWGWHLEFGIRRELLRVVEDDELKTMLVEKVNAISPDQLRELVTLLKDAAKGVSRELVRRLIQTEEADLLEAAIRLIESKELEANYRDFNILAVNPSPGAKAVVEAFVDRFPTAKSRQECLSQSEFREQDTPASRRLWEEVPHWPVGFRSKIAFAGNLGWLSHMTLHGQQTLAQDPEPIIRLAALNQLLESKDEKIHEAALQAILNEPGPPDLFFQVARRRGIALTRFLENQDSSVRRRVLTESFQEKNQQKKRSAVEILASGLQVDAPLVIEVLLKTGSDDYLRSMRDENDLSDFYKVLEQVIGLDRQDLIQRAWLLLEGFSKQRGGLFLEEPPVKEFIRAVAQHRLAVLRIQVVESPLFESLPQELKKALALDRHGRASSMAVKKIHDPTLMNEVADLVHEREWVTVFQKAKAAFDYQSIKTLYSRSGSRPLFQQNCFLAVLGEDPAFTVRGLLNPFQGTRSIAVNWVTGLPLEPTLGEQVMASIRNGKFQTAVDQLLENIDAVHAARREKTILEAQRKIETATQEHEFDEALRQLVGVGAKAELLEYCFYWNLGLTPFKNLVALEAWDEVRIALHEMSRVPISIDLPAAFDDDWVALAKSGRVPWRALIGRIEPARAIAEFEKGMFEVRNLDVSLMEELVSHCERVQNIDALIAFSSYTCLSSLIRLEAYEPMFKAMMGPWPRNLSQEAARKLQELTQIPSERNDAWPTFQVNQKTRIDQWRQALELN